MFGIGIGIWLRLAAIAAMAIAVYAFVYAVEHWCNTVCKEARADNVALRESLDRTKKLATDMTNLWDAKRQQAEKQADDDELTRASLFAAVESSRSRLSAAVSGRVVPAVAAGVLNDAVRAGNRASAPAAGEVGKDTTPATGDSNLGAVVDWGITCSRYYSTCRSQVIDLVDFYNGLREAQPKETTP